MKTSIVCLTHLVIILLSFRTVAVHFLAAAIACGATAPPALADFPDAFRFVESGQRLGNLITTGIELADVDEDGDLDAITPSYLGPAAIWLNQGDGVMIEAANRIESEFFTSDFELADFSGDGFVDLLAPNSMGGAALYLNDGTGQFELFQPLPQSHSSCVAAGDLDGDGDLDAMFGSIGGHPNAAAFNDGTGHLTASPNGNGPPANSISLGDLDGDGDLDAFVAIGFVGTTQSFANWVLLNNGDGFFTDSGQRLGDGLSAAVQLGDIDLDGDLDALVINAPFDSHSAADMVWLNDGSGIFADSGQRLGEAFSGDLDLADFDNDGDLDALICRANAPDIVRINDGAGRFESTVVVDSNEPRFFKSAVGDLDGDGDVDIFTAKSSADGDRVYLNEPVGLTTLVPDAVVVTRGISIAGGVTELAESDNADLSIQRSIVDIQSRTEFEVKAVSSVPSPASLEVTLEGSVFARTQVNQTIELFDYDGGSWEPVDTRAATRFTDSMVTVAATGDLSRFVEPGTLCIEARIRYQSPVVRQRFSSNTDQFIWTIGQ